ncbi:hypothetical protein H7F33_08785 [Pedobacter sp. PAMC26386]|nr:hypothetical protein H7F33_08785 [Pedobacter sp. PAMC26386]
MRSRNLIHKISLPVGVILMVISVIILKNSLEFVKNSERAVGVVTELEKTTDQDDSSYAPVFLIKFSWSIVSMSIAVFLVTTGGGYYLIRRQFN